MLSLLGQQGHGMVVQVDHDSRTLYTGAELMRRLRGLPEHLRPGQVEL